MSPAMTPPEPRVAPTPHAPQKPTVNITDAPPGRVCGCNPCGLPAAFVFSGIAQNTWCKVSLGSCLDHLIAVSMIMAHEMTAPAVPPSTPQAPSIHTASARPGETCEVNHCGAPAPLMLSGIKSTTKQYVTLHTCVAHRNLAVIGLTRELSPGYLELLIGRPQ